MVARLAWLTGISVGLALAMVRLDAGGWAVVTLKDVPEYVVAGKPVSLMYAVRQHGTHLTPGLSGRIEAREAQGGAVVRVAATPASDTGYYTANLTLPTAGDWTMTVDSGFWGSNSGPIALRVVKPGDPAPPQMTAAARGNLLLAAKGCLSCHTRSGQSNGLGFAPDLTTPRYPAAYLKTFLADPSIKPPSKPGLVMPNLQLTHGEIGALVALLSVDAKPTATAEAR